MMDVSTSEERRTQTKTGWRASPEWLAYKWAWVLWLIPMVYANAIVPLASGSMSGAYVVTLLVGGIFMGIPVTLFALAAVRLLASFLGRMGLLQKHVSAKDRVGAVGKVLVALEVVYLVGVTIYGLSLGR